MTLQIHDLLLLLGKYANDPDVGRAIAANAFPDVYEDPPFNRYVGSTKRGVSLLFEDDRIVDVQVYVQATKLYSEFDGELPLGIRKGMTQQDVHQLLGEPETFDEFDSKFRLDSNNQLTVVYDKFGVVRYLSVALPL